MSLVDAPSEPGPELDHLAHTVIGAAIEVHRCLGPGMPEAVYEEALCLELTLRGTQVARQVPVNVTYKLRSVGRVRLDVVVASKLIVELKAVEAVLPLHEAQLLSYLKAAKLRLGLLLNFNVPKLRDGIKRCINTPR